jgi:hypothetical protein
MQNTPNNDRNMLQAWLETRPQADSIAIAHRSALRVLPESYAHRVQSKDSEFELLLLQFLRMTLLAAIRPETLTPEFRQIAAAAANPIAKPAKSTPINDNTRYITHSMITYGILPAASYASGIAAASAFDSVYAGKVWTALDRDAAALQAGTDPFTQPLWHGETPPVWFTARYAAMISSWQTTNPKQWAFWLRWYDAAIAGRPLDLQLQHDIALIPNAIWQSGPGPVAEAIAKIEAEHKQGTSTTPQTDTLTTANERTRSIKFVIKQVALLHDLIEDEFEHLRGHNSASATEQPLRDQQKATLQKLRDLVNAMLTALDSDPSPSTALTVVNEIVPVVVTEAETLTDKGIKPEVSAEIISMAATIKVLTESGAPGDLATKIAFANSSRNWFWSMFPKWRKGKN